MKTSAEGGGRTHTVFEHHWILSPARLPVPPLRLKKHYNIINSVSTHAGATVQRIPLELHFDEATLNGPEGDRTPGLHNAIVALSQLSYRPNQP